MNLNDEQKDLMQFAHKFDIDERIEREIRRKRMFDIISSNLNIENEIVVVKSRLERLFAEDKKTSFYPHKLQIRKHIADDQLYLSDLYNALIYIEDLAHLDHIEYLDYNNKKNDNDMTLEFADLKLDE